MSLLDSRLSLGEIRRALVGHAETVLQCEADPRNGAFVKQPADEGYAVGHTLCGVELRRRVFRIGRPIAARLCDLHEPCSEGQRGVTREIADREHFVPE